MNERNVAASVRARLFNRARATKQDFSLVLTRYAIERLLYRISVSKHADQFLLKGALLFDLWFDIPHRPTRDADFLGFGSAELPHIEGAFREICAIETHDGVTFLWILSQHIEFDGNTLRRAIRSTFDRRKTMLPPDTPFGLADGFAQDAQKQTQWQAFLGKNRLEVLRLEDVVTSLRDFLLPVIAAASADTDYLLHWPAGGPWSVLAT